MEQKQEEIFNKILFLRKRFRDEEMREIFENRNKSIIEIYEKNIAKNNSKCNDRYSVDKNKSLKSHFDRYLIF